MPRKKCNRRIQREPTVSGFTPVGCNRKKTLTIQLERDELEAIRLADLMGLYHKDAAEKMEISRATFGRILSGAHYKVADALIAGKILNIQPQQLSCPKYDNSECSCPTRIDELKN